MRTHVALLRGVNVGGRNRIAMADLRAVVTSLGHTDVSTYIQSGNVVFCTAETDTAALVTVLERAIAQTLGVAPRVVVLAREELSQVVANNPYPDEADHRRLHAAFSGEQISPDQLRFLETVQQRASDKGSRDKATVIGRTLYLHTPDGIGRSELAAQLARAGGLLAATGSATMRNWATVMTLLALCRADGERGK
jgi:uncharacterized protein (DUF1697 family)